MRRGSVTGVDAPGAGAGLDGRVPAASAAMRSRSVMVFGGGGPVDGSEKKLEYTAPIATRPSTARAYTFFLSSVPSFIAPPSVPWRAVAQPLVPAQRRARPSPAVRPHPGL